MFTVRVGAIWRGVARAQGFETAGSLGGVFWATTATAAAMAQEMKKAVQGSRVAGAAAMAGRPGAQGGLRGGLGHWRAGVLRWLEF
jgi:hypothetical protein